MTKQEFEERIGRKVEMEEYAAADRVYMSTSNGLDKDTFCKDYREHSGSLIIADLMKQLRISDKALNDTQHDLKKLTCQVEGSKADWANRLLASAEEIRMGVCDPAKEIDELVQGMVGIRAYIAEKLSNNLTITEDDKALILQELRIEPSSI